MRTIITLFLLIFLQKACKSQDLSRASVPSIDSLRKVNLSIINDTNQVRYVTQGFVRFWMPKENHLHIIDSIFVSAITENKEWFYVQLKPDSINTYYQQLICYIESNGDSIVYINALCWIPEYPITDENNKVIWKKIDWQKQVINVKDGGDCFWRIKINISKKNYSNFIVNGIA